jgi:hypothetical protein
MVRRTALAGSLAVHGAIAGVLVLVLAHEPPDERTGPAPGGTTVEVVNAPATPPSPTAGGAPAPAAAAPRAPRHARTLAPRTTGTPTFAVETTMRLEEPGARGGAASDGGGAGNGGRGGGLGAGIGLGDGNGIANPSDIAALPLPMPARMKVSLARPPQLIWPKREGEIVESELYVARLIIDADGLVDGVRLVRRFREPRDDDAEAAVWKFRYRPALDDDGHPTRATIEQPFMLHVR